MKQSSLNALDLLAFLFSLILLPIAISLFLIKENEIIQTLKIIDTTLCCFLLLHFSLRLKQTKNKIGFIKNNWMDLLGSIPMIEPLRYFRLLGIFRVISVIKKSNETSKILKNNKVEYHTAIAIMYFIVVITVGSSLILLFEKQSPDANINSIIDAVWWVFVTISTVGYGDHYPITTAGKILAVFVITSGVGLFGFFISLFTQSFTKDEASEIKKLHNKIDALHDEIKKSKEK